mgnify:CR=1 FL=1
MKAATRAVCTALAGAVLSACSHASAPQAPAPRIDRQVRDEIRSGVRAYHQRAYSNALSHFNRALALDPHDWDARYDRAVTEERLRAFGRSEADLREVVNARPQWGAARLHLAAAQYRAHDFSAAARNFDIVLRDDSKAWNVWLDDGASYYQLHRYGDARRRLARALDLAPRSGRAHFWLGLTYRRLGQTSKARGELALAAHSRDRGVRDAARRMLKT